MVRRTDQPRRGGTQSHAPFLSLTKQPTIQVPAITYGGPVVPPDQPSPESTKFAESLVLIEFIADLYPDSQLLPSCPILRARARLFIKRFDDHNSAIRAYLGTAGPGTREAFLDAIDMVQRSLPDDLKGEGEYAVGKGFTVADVVAMPRLVFLDAVFQTGMGAFDGEEGKLVEEALKRGRFARWARYCEVLRARESFNKVYTEVGSMCCFLELLLMFPLQEYVEMFKRVFGSVGIAAREARKAAAAGPQAN
jgi:glutathione S-transferase